MKKLFSLTALFISMFIFAQENFEITTLRIGPFHLKKGVAEIEKIAGKELKTYDDYTKLNAVSYNKEIVNVYVFSSSENDKIKKNVGYFSTKSSKFKTKKGIGVGSTKNQVFEAYKDFQKFEFIPGWDDKAEKYSKTKSHFSIFDLDAGTYLSFTLENNIVTEVLVGFDDSDGC